MKKEKTSFWKILAVTAAIGAAVVGVAYVVIKLCKKYLTIEFECGDCETCENPCEEVEDGADELECVEEAEAEEAEIIPDAAELADAAE